MKISGGKMDPTADRNESSKIPVGMLIMSLS